MSTSLWCIYLVVFRWFRKGVFCRELSFIILGTIWNWHYRWFSHHFLLWVFCFLHLFDWYIALLLDLRLFLYLFGALVNFSRIRWVSSLCLLLLSWDNLDILLFFLLNHLNFLFIFFQWKVLTFIRSFVCFFLRSFTFWKLDRFNRYFYSFLQPFFL